MSGKGRKPRFDNRHIRLKTGESQIENGTYTYRWTDRYGKRCAVYAPTLDELREKEEQIVIDRHDGIRSDRKMMTVNDLYELWKEMKRGIKDSTRQGYIYTYETFVRKTFGQKRVVSLKKSDVRLFYNRLIEDRCLKVSTVDSIHNVVYQVLQVAVDDNWIRNNPADNVLRELKKAVGSDAEVRQALTIPQQNLFKEYMLKNKRYTHWYPVFFVMMTTGMRVGEITGLRWRDVDLEKGIISVNHTLVYYNHGDGKGCSYSINTPKTRAGIREIPMTEEVKKAFYMEKEFQEMGGIVSTALIEGYDDFVFLNQIGNVHSQSTLNKAIRRIVRDCNFEVLEKHSLESGPVLLPAFSCHNLRHTAATRLIESGSAITFIKSVLGHASINTTMEVYYHLTEEVKNTESRVYESYLDKVSGGDIETAEPFGAEATG